jgi:hypothetical protein
MQVPEGPVGGAFDIAEFTRKEEHQNEAARNSLINTGD